MLNLACPWCWTFETEDVPVLLGHMLECPRKPKTYPGEWRLDASPEPSSLAAEPPSLA